MENIRINISRKIERIITGRISFEGAKIPSIPPIIQNRYVSLEMKHLFSARFFNDIIYVDFTLHCLSESLPKAQTSPQTQAYIKEQIKTNGKIKK